MDKTIETITGLQARAEINASDSQPNNEAILMACEQLINAYLRAKLDKLDRPVIKFQMFPNVEKNTIEISLTEFFNKVNNG